MRIEDDGAGDVAVGGRGREMACCEGEGERCGGRRKEAYC